MGIVFILVEKNGRSPLKYSRGFISKFENMSNEWRFDLNVPKIRVKCFIPLTKVNIINFDFDQNILHQFCC